MPKGTKVDRCFQQVKQEQGESSAAAICQSSTGQSLATGKKKRKSDGKPIGSAHESFEQRLHRTLFDQ
jgi:hypothetical protein